MRLYTEEPSAEQFACSVLDWRRVDDPFADHTAASAH